MMSDTLKRIRTIAIQEEAERKASIQTSVSDLLQTFIDVLYRELCHELEKAASEGRSSYAFFSEHIKSKIEPWDPLIKKSDRTLGSLVESVVDAIYFRLKNEGLQVSVGTDDFKRFCYLAISWN